VKQPSHLFFRLFSFLQAAIACLVGGCAVGPDYSGTGIPVLPASYKESLGCESACTTSVLPCQATCEPRLILFSDPILNALVTRAQQQNLDLRESYQRIVEARAWAKMTRGGLFPQADAIAEYGRTKRSRNARPFVGANGIAFDLFSLGFDSSWEIDLFGKLHRQVEASEAELAAQHENFQDVQLILQADVATNYVRVRVLQKQLLIAQQNLKLQEETSEFIEQLQKAGKVSTLDVSQARALRYSTMSEVPELEQQLQLVFNQLSILLGEAPGPAMRSFVGYGPIPALPELNALGIPADLVRRRPDIRRAEQDVVAASARIGVAKADLYPQLALLGTLSVNSRNVSSLFASNSLSYSVGPSFRWNILNFWRVTSNIKAYEAQFDQAVTRYRNVVLEAVREVEDGLSNNHWEQFRKTALEQTILADAESVELSLSRYKAGKASYQRVLDSQEQLLRDEQKLAASRGALALFSIRISKAVAGGWCGRDSLADQGSGLGNRMFSPPKKLPPQSPKMEALEPKAKLPKNSSPASAEPAAKKAAIFPSPEPPRADDHKTNAKTDAGEDASESQSNNSSHDDTLWRLPSTVQSLPPIESEAPQNVKPTSELDS